MDTSVDIEKPVEGVLALRLNRPERRNAVDEALLSALHGAVNSHPATRVLILGSTDSRSFCSGGDLSLAPSDLARVSDGLYQFYEDLVTAPYLVLVAADGSAIGAGAQLLLCADFAFGGQQLNVSYLGAKSGLSVGTWGLPERVGRGTALDLCITGRTVGAVEAASIGLVDRLVEDPFQSAMTLACDLISHAPVADGSLKRLIRNFAPTAASIRAEREVNFGRIHPQAGEY